MPEHTQPTLPTDAELDLPGQVTITLAELLLAADLSGLDLVALMVDGIRVAEHCCVAALGITLDGTEDAVA